MWNEINCFDLEINADDLVLSPKAMIGFYKR